VAGGRDGWWPGWLVARGRGG